MKKIAIFLLAILYIYYSAPIDLYFTGLFYLETIPHFQSTQFWDFIFNYGTWPAIAIASLGLLFFIISFRLPNIAKYRSLFLNLFLTMAIGSGLFVHGIFKDHWGRPRPRQVVEFGGDQPFRAFYEPNLTLRRSPFQSFPCGHCSIGFYFWTLIYEGKKWNIRYLYYAGILCLLFFGITLSYSRLIQGGHFVSDIVFSYLIMWQTAKWLAKR